MQPALQKVILISGANGGLGRHVTQACLSKRYRVAGVAPGISETDSSSPDFFALPARIGAEDAEVVIENARARWGRLDGLVHLVGAFDGGLPLTESPDELFSRMWDVNLMSFVYAARAILPVLRAQRSGTLVAIGSRVVAHPQPGLSAYAASKAALISLVQTLARENREFGVTVNAIVPGTMDTPANRKAMPDVDPATWVQPSQVAAAIVHLLSDQASQISGAIIPVFGNEL